MTVIDKKMVEEVWEAAYRAALEDAYEKAWKAVYEAVWFARADTGKEASEIAAASVVADSADRDSARAARRILGEVMRARMRIYRAGVVHKKREDDKRWVAQMKLWKTSSTTSRIT